MHHFHRAAGKAEGHRPERSRSGPIDDLVCRGGQEPLLKHTVYRHSPFRSEPDAVFFIIPNPMRPSSIHR